MNGGTSWRTRERPATNDQPPIVAQWWTATAPDNDAGVHTDMSAQQRAVGQHAVVADATVVGHVAAGHQKIAVADRGHALFLFRGALIVTPSRMTLPSPMSTLVRVPR